MTEGDLMAQADTDIRASETADLIAIICDERHAENGTGVHVASGFCRACAEVYVALNLYQQHYAMCDGTLVDGTPVHKDSYRRGVHDGQRGRQAGEWEWRGAVDTAGGGIVSIRVDRNESSYPIAGDRVRVLTTPSSRTQPDERAGEGGS